MIIFFFKFSFTDDDQMGPEVFFNDIDPLLLKNLQKMYNLLDEEHIVTVTLTKAMGKTTIEEPRVKEFLLFK